MCCHRLTALAPFLSDLAQSPGRLWTRPPRRTPCARSASVRRVPAHDHLRRRLDAEIAALCPHLVECELSGKMRAIRFAYMVDDIITLGSRGAGWRSRSVRTSPAVERRGQGADRGGVLYAGRGRVRSGAPARHLAATLVQLAQGGTRRAIEPAGWFHYDGTIRIGRGLRHEGFAWHQYLCPGAHSDVADCTYWTFITIRQPPARAFGLAPHAIVKSSTPAFAPPRSSNFDGEYIQYCYCCPLCIQNIQSHGAFR
jgi:hypothetical protein